MRGPQAQSSLLNLKYFNFIRSPFHCFSKYQEGKISQKPKPNISYYFSTLYAYRYNRPYGMYPTRRIKKITKLIRKAILSMSSRMGVQGLGLAVVAASTMVVSSSC